MSLFKKVLSVCGFTSVGIVSFLSSEASAEETRSGNSLMNFSSLAKGKAVSLQSDEILLDQLKKGISPIGFEASMTIERGTVSHSTLTNHSP